MSDLPLISTESRDLSPATLRSRLVPYRVQHVANMHLYEFRRGKESEVHESRAHGINCDSALIVFWDGRSVFRLQYYPNGDAPQITRELPMQDLYVAVNDLAQAGFPVVREITSNAAVAERKMHGTPKPALPSGAS
jgi:hypothetical protein